jgi:hypothetical protein
MALTREHLEKLAQDEMERLFTTIPRARAFHSGAWIDRDYYIRHVMETILRIRLNNEVDAYSLHKMGSRDLVLAQRLAQHLAEEYGHEDLFLRDLEASGVTKAQVDATSVFPSTKELIGFMYLAINEDGPLPTMVWDWFVEWYSDRYNGVITNKAAHEYGDGLVRGSLAHIHYDESHDHDDLMWGSVVRAMALAGDDAKASAYLRHYIRAVGRYFDELYQSTVGARALGRPVSV